MTIIPTQKRSVPLKMVGSTVFGRYPKISEEETFNMIISDGFLVPFAGHKKIFPIEDDGDMRGLFNSIPLGKLVIVMDNNIYLYSKTGSLELRANIDTYTGDVSIDENDASQIAISDGKDIYVIDYKNNVFGKATINFIPGFITSQNGRFISPERGRAAWRLSALNDGFTWPDTANSVGGFQTKADIPVAAIRLPDKSNQIFIMGSSVTESWVDIGATLFPYQKTTAFNIDYGCANPATIATGDKFIIWLGINEKSGPVILYSEGGEPIQISNDGINFRLASLTNPRDAVGFLFKQDGHLIYMLTFRTDNITYIYDFNTKAFFTLTDAFYNHHEAKRVVFFDDKYYFISFNDGNLYELNSIYTTYDGETIPRRRKLPPFRLTNNASFFTDNITFVIEQGTAKSEQAIDLSMSRDGGYMFGNNGRTILRTLGNRKSKYKRWNLGRANDLTLQFDFWSKDRFVLSNGIMNIHGRHVNESP